LDQRPLVRKSFESDAEWLEFKDWLSHKYAKSHVPSILSYCKKYNYILYGDVRDVDKLSPASKGNVVRALIVLSKYLGIHEQFKTSLKNYGVKLFSPDAFSSFMRVYNNQNANLNDWYQKTCRVLRPNEQLYLHFLSMTGLRLTEGIISFNKIIENSKQGNLERVLQRRERLT